MQNRWRDTGLRYGPVTRGLHWLMALLLLWQFSGIVLYKLFGQTFVSDLINLTHGELGLAVLVLAAVRAVWGLYNLKDRPQHEGGFLGLTARTGHLALYLLMLAIPALALLRAISSEWGLALFGWQVVARSDTNVDWMVAPANLLHGLLAWALLAMIAGHVAMVFIHRHVWKDDVLARMAGPPLTPAE
jgi:cytochrome b561